jgi:hypothetical protein
MQQSPGRKPHRGEPSLPSLALHACLLLALVATLGIVVVIKPIGSDGLTLLVTGAILAGSLAVGGFLVRERDAPTMDSGKDVFEDLGGGTSR